MAHKSSPPPIIHRLYRSCGPSRPAVGPGLAGAIGALGRAPDLRPGGACGGPSCSPEAPSLIVLRADLRPITTRAAQRRAAQPGDGVGAAGPKPGREHPRLLS